MITTAKYTCKKCKRQFPTDRLPITRKACKGLPQTLCLKCRTESREQGRNYSLQMKYGLTREEYNEMLERQGGGCAICASKTPGSKRHFFCVDHCHDTGLVRGLLCCSCNMALAQVGDTLEGVMRFVSYIKTGQASPTFQGKSRPAVPLYQKPLLKVEEVASMLTTCERTIWAWVAEGKLPEPVRKGRRWVRWRRSEIEEWTEARA